MKVTPADIKSRRRIGTLKGKPVTLLNTTGGFWIVAGEKNGKPSVLGTGPHRAVAIYGAQKAEPDMEVSELSKSDHIDEASILSVLAKYEAITAEMNELLDLSE